MSLIWKVCCLNIPINGQGAAEHDIQRGKFKNTITIALSEKEYNLLNDIFTDFNHRFDILIDIFEEETIESDNAIAALEILAEHRSACSKEDKDFLNAAAKLERALRLSVKYNTCVYFDF